MIFEQLNPHSCRSYLIGMENDHRVIIVDPVIEHFNDYLDLLKKRDLQLTHVIDTHSHADHISGASVLKDITNCSYIMHRNAIARCSERRVEDGDILELNGLKIQVLFTPGHSRDSISLIVGDKILTGDFLFLDQGGGGRDDLPGGDPGTHWESLRKLENLPEDLIVCPAHDYYQRQPSALKKQYKSNPHLMKRSKKEFVAYMESLKVGPADWMKDVLQANYTCAKDPKAVWIPADAAACQIPGIAEPGVNEQVVTPISGEELIALLHQEGAQPVLLDVRETAELSGELGSIDGVRNIPVTVLASRLSELEELKTKKIVTICLTGPRSMTAAQILQKAGFRDVHYLAGGMMAWRKNGY